MKARVHRLAFLCCSLVPAMASAQGVAVVTSFPGDSGPGPKDNPDNTGGVRPGHVVDCTDESAYRLTEAGCELRGKVGG